MRSADSKTRCGHTLLEATIAALILGICVAVAVPRFSSSIENTRVNASIKRIQADLQHARQNARRTNSEQTIEFSVDDNSYELVGVEELDRKQGGYQFHFGDETSAATLIEADFNGESDLVFEPSGRLKSTGTLTLRWSDATVVQLEVDVLGRVTRLVDEND